MELNGLSVLVVDDSANIRALVAGLMSGVRGVATVDEAAGAAEARRMLASRPPDLVILDVRMPGGSGIELLQAIRRDRLPVLVVMLTNYPLAPYRRACLEAGADYFLDKSTELDLLVDIVGRIASKTELDRD